MTPERVADMTVEELKAIISQVVDERLQEERKSSVSAKKRSLQEIMESVVKLSQDRFLIPAILLLILQLCVPILQSQ